MDCHIAMIGAIGHANIVLEGLRELGGKTLCAVAPGCPEEDVDALRRRLAPTPETRVYADYRELLARERPDIVAVSPYFYLHAEVACAALGAGAAVFCEKPLSLTLEGLAEVRRAQAAAGRPVSLMLNFRYTPAFHTARKLVAAGAIGVPTLGFGQKSYKRGKRSDFYRRRETFGGITPWVGIHAVDWLRWVSGCEYRSVVSQHVKLHAPEYPGMEDAATCLYELDNGGSAVMSFDFLRPAGAPSHGDDRLRLCGDAGVLEIRGESHLELITPKGADTVPVEQPPHGCFADFVRTVLDPSAPPCAISTEDAFRVTQIVLRTRDAADRGERVAL